MSNTAKQAFSLSNDGGRIVISGNTLTNADADESGRGAIRIVGAATTAKFTISGNTVSGSENAAIYVGGTISGGGAVVANDNDFAGNTVVVRNESNVKVNAALNWWGSATPDFASLAIGSVTTDPFYTDEARSKMSTATPAGRRLRRTRPADP